MNSIPIVAIENFLSPEECAELITLIETTGFQSQFSGTGRLIRSRAVFQSEHWAKIFWERLAPRIPMLTEVYGSMLAADPVPHAPLDTYNPIQLNERFRCYKYGVDEEFQKHKDFAYEYSDVKRTFLTVLIYLNNGYAGGETVFDNYEVQPQLGSLVMFPHELPHQGAKIVSGMKYSLRTDVVYETEHV